MYKVVVLCALFFLPGDANILHSANHSSDEPESTHGSSVPFQAAGSYEQALQVWKTAEDINGWIAANFSYDMARAMQLSETQRTSNEKVSIYTPAEFFAGKPGICVDLSRFGVETLRRIDPQSEPQYLMIEFDPMQIAGNVLRLHWLVSFKREGKTYFFADSNRPGHIAGPYDDTQVFIRDYEQYRGRKIVAFRELESYLKRPRMPALKQPVSAKP
jgi:hypothetical protein